MDGPGGHHVGDRDDGQWAQTFPWLARTNHTRKLQSLLERAEAAHRTSASLMRAMGREDRALRAEQFAAWVRLELEEPETARLLYAVAKNLRGAARQPASFSWRGASGNLLARSWPATSALPA